MSYLTISLCLSAAVFLLILRNKWNSHHRAPLPPGPKGLPFVGTPSELPQDYTWLYVAKHKDLYGPISSVTVFGNTYVIFNDAEVAEELLNKRSSNYSERPQFVFGEMCGLTNLLSILSTGPILKDHRTAVQHSFGSNDSITRRGPIIEAEMRRFLAHILTNPGELETGLKSLAAAIVLEVTYGYAMETKHPDPLVEEIEELNRMFAQAIQPAAWLVDALPILRHIPTWMPGSGFKKTAKTWQNHVFQSVERPYLFVKQQMAAGTARPSYISILLEQYSEAPDQYWESIYKWSAATMYGAGTDTTVSLFYSFFIAMVLYPEVQKKAQAEIDEVIGSNRLPTLLDRESLPYVNAVVTEVLRWHSSVPLGVPHVAKEDDVYNGYLIPKGSTILPNIWLFNHDPSNYHNPFAFKPERFLGTGGIKPELDPSTTVFGFGRRICVGKKLAQSIIFHAIAMSLATLSIGKARDANGMEVTPVFEFSGGMLSHPKPFEYNLTARSEKARELITTVDNEGDIAHNDAAAIQTIVLDI